MADIDWRVWVYNRLCGSALFTARVPVESVYGAGSLTGVPDAKPFCVIRLGDESDGVQGPVLGTSITDCTLWFHDETGSFNVLRTIADLARDALCGSGQRVGQVSDPGGIIVRWQSHGPDRSDEGYGTLVKTSEYELIGKDGHG